MGASSEPRRRDGARHTDKRLGCRRRGDRCGVVDTHGRVLLHDLRRRGASSYADVHGPLMRVLKRASIICVYNVDFEMKMIRQSAERHGLDATLDAETVCIMQEYADHYSADGRWSKLEDAARVSLSVLGAPRTGH